jgi:hypothetical protein
MNLDLYISLHPFSWSALVTIADQYAIPLHVDGSRIFNAAAAAATTTTSGSSSSDSNSSIPDPSPLLSGAASANVCLSKVALSDSSNL